MSKSSRAVVRGGEEGPRARQRGALWKEWLPRAALRTSFEWLSEGARAIGRRVKGGHKHTNDVRNMVAREYMEGQRNAIHKAVARESWASQHNWVV